MGSRKSLGTGVLSLFFGLALSACDSARMSSHKEPQGDDGGGQEKTKCGDAIATYAVMYESGKSEIGAQLVGALTPWEGDLSPVENYNYRSSAADTVLGPKPAPYLATHFMYEVGGQAYLYLLFDGYFDSNEDASVDVDIRVVNNEFHDQVIFSDEQGELRVADYDTISTIYRGEFSYKRYSDGGVIGPLVGKKWKIEIRYQTVSRLNSAGFFDVEGKVSQMTSEDLVSGQLTIMPAMLNKCDFSKL